MEVLPNPVGISNPERIFPADISRNNRSCHGYGVNDGSPFN